LRRKNRAYLPSVRTCRRRSATTNVSKGPPGPGNGLHLKGRVAYQLRPFQTQLSQTTPIPSRRKKKNPKKKTTTQIRTFERGERIQVRGRRSRYVKKRLDALWDRGKHLQVRLRKKPPETKEKTSEQKKEIHAERGAPAPAPATFSTHQRQSLGKKGLLRPGGGALEKKSLFTVICR